MAKEKKPEQEKTGQGPEQSEQNEQKTPVQQQNPPPAENDKLDSERFILVADLEEQKIHAFKNNKETVPFDKDNESEFLKIDKNSILENFVSNLASQYENPKRFKVMALPVKFLEAIGKTIDKLFQLRPPQNIIEFYDKHTVNDPELKVKQMQKETDGNFTSRYKIDEGMIDWNEIKNELGISREYLASNGHLEALLRGGKTSVAIPIRTDLKYARITGTARLQFKRRQTGVPYLDTITPRTKPELKTFYGHEFTPSERLNLLEKGLMGHSVFLNNEDGGRDKCIIGLDPVTNEVVAVKVNNVTIPDNKCGVELTEKEKETLRAGGEVRLEEMVSANTGTTFSGTLYIDPNTSQVEIRFDSKDLFERKTLGGKKLTEEELKGLKAGDAVKIENMVSKNGNIFDRFVKMINDKPEFFKFNPDSPEDNREVIIPKYVSGKKIPDEDMPKFAAGDPIFVEDMRKANGEKMDRFIQLSLETGEVRYAMNIEDLHKTLDEMMEQKEFKLPQEQFGHKFKPSEHADLRAGKTLEINDMTGSNGLPLGPRWARADQKTGYMNYYTVNPDTFKEKTKIENNQKQVKKQGNSRGVA